jgi:hypothetical protein
LKGPLLSFRAFHPAPNQGHLDHLFRHIPFPKRRA